ncbi:DUF3800 domain-containing protein [bacterium]|nr:MAG: DUF3800 domain-containing protein [bacterium]
MREGGIVCLFELVSGDFVASISGCTMSYVSAEHYTIYLDESGDHSLRVIQPNYPVFGLGGVLVASDDHAAYATSLSAWKTAFFGRDVCLHLQDINRNKGPFAILKGDNVLRTRLFAEMQAELDRYNFTLICGVIDKRHHLEVYGAVARDPYCVTLEFLIERFYRELRSRRSRAGIIAESRGRDLDAALQLHYAALLRGGTFYVTGRELRSRLAPEIEFQPKHPDAAGLQISDIVIGPVCRDILGLTTPYRVTMTHKMRRDALGNVAGYGLKVFPEK